MVNGATLARCRQSLVTPIDWKRDSAGLHLYVWEHGRQSLVTPIDWKQVLGVLKSGISPPRRQSLVTPIDWKPTRLAKPILRYKRRQSLVTPIDWKLPKTRGLWSSLGSGVANPW